MIKHVFYIDSSNTNIKELDNWEGYKVSVEQLPYPLRKGDIIHFSAALMENVRFMERVEFISEERDIPINLFKNIYGVVKLSILDTDENGHFVYVLITLVKDYNIIELS